jgi:hypothetical protein
MKQNAQRNEGKVYLPASITLKDSWVIVKLSCLSIRYLHFYENFMGLF